ncbi:DUF167 family protein [uncultured Ferrovibrio sp.]|uniref:DUF167 family protein n=1 Tax=uncultured Ferrovibrio sp. TaxID=1576913 RepID=UPI002607AC9E|nr:DUF167 family protein [uncultured Ferrovibrio sp.]
MADPRPYSLQEDGLRLFVRLTPKSGRDAVEGLKPTADGGAELAAKVTAVPEKGKANAALIKLLSKALKLPGGRFEIVAGETDRHKQILIHGDPAALEAALRPWLATLDMKG